jgi:hypothetical protein
MALSHLFAGRFDMAASRAEQSFRQLPTFFGPRDFGASLFNDR